MDEEFPLSLPSGTAAVSLPWHDGHDDLGWIVQASTGHSASATWTFGTTNKLGRHVCLHRFKLWWLKPSHGQSGLDIPPETALFLAEQQQQRQQQRQQYVALLPVSDTHARASLHRAGGGMGSVSSDGGKTNPSGPSAGVDRPVFAVSADTGDAATLLPDTLGVLLVATGRDPFRLVKRLVREATERLSAQLLSVKEEASLATRRVSEEIDRFAAGEGAASHGGESKQQSVARFVDNFGWCTWDSFYTMVTPEGVLEGLSTLHKRGVRPRWVVIDDGWQQTTNDDALNTEQWDERMVGLKANKRFRRFDDKGNLLLDLGDTVGKMKRDFGVEQVLAWHAMTGYWAGVEPEATEMAPFDPLVIKLVAPEGIREVDPTMQPELDGKRFGMVRPSHVKEFYLAYHRYLKDNGIDGVKVDAQSILECMGGGNGGVPTVTRAYHEGLFRSVQNSFKEGNRPAALIHCMCHAPSVLFHIACLSQDRVVIRGSDDFYPREDLSHGPHLYSNAFNALLLSNLGVQDWDMFQTGLGLPSRRQAETTANDEHPNAAAIGEGSKASWLHAAARAISGGPVYVSDRPGQHNTDILKRLVLEDGSVLRASTNALPTADCLMRDPQNIGGGLLQLWALNAAPGTGVVGSFNIQGSSFSQSARSWVASRQDVEAEGGETSAAVKGTVSPSDVHAFRRTKNQASRADAGEIEPAPGSGGEWVEEEGPSWYALYLYRRREARVVGLLEAVEIEVPPLSYELATFSKVVDLRLPSLGSSGSKERPGADAGEADDLERDEEDQIVRWAALGLSDMFNSSAAVSAQEPTSQSGEIPWKSTVRGDGGGKIGPGVSLAIKGSGKFLAVASRRPSLATLAGGGCGEADPASVGVPGIAVVRREGISNDVDGVVVLDASFSALSADASSTTPGRASLGMGLVEVSIPGPWDGRERQLEFWWERCD